MVFGIGKDIILIFSVFMRGVKGNPIECVIFFKTMKSKSFVNINVFDLNGRVFAKLQVTVLIFKTGQKFVSSAMMRTM
ncbi:hypothetical protein MsAc7_06050 [Methanolapillus millepedarum]|uniref:Uncharacterized protein n=1 Tax=Methanolapillus millepedarum TaxID=3028296 RepID=A0AA96VBI4_9EURY|nr:hypothetical protein MsAc7_06050 [Methanosarcinaceae archaeon Ac7]